MTTDNATSTYVIENTFGAIKLTINGRKKLAMFWGSIFVWVIRGLCFLPILGLMIGVILQKYLPEGFAIFIWVLIFGLWIYIIYVKIRETLEFVFDKEVIEIHSQAIRIEKSGWGFKSVKEYSGEQIKGISLVFPTNSQTPWLTSLLFKPTDFDAFALWLNRRNKFHFFGNHLAQSDAQTILDTILSEFPQFKCAGNS